MWKVQTCLLEYVPTSNQVQDNPELVPQCVYYLLLLSGAMCGNFEIVKDIVLTKQAKILQQTDKR